MAILQPSQAMKKTPAMQKIIHFKEAFINTINRRTVVHIWVDTLKPWYSLINMFPLKSKRADKGKKGYISDEASSAGYEVHDEMSTTTHPLPDLLSCSKTKGLLARLHAQGLLEEFEGDDG